MPQPTVSQVHVNRPLTNISVAFAQAATSFGAARVLPGIGVAGVPGAGEFKQWNDDASTPIEDITLAGVAMAGLTGKRPNVIVCGPSVLQSLKNHPDVLDRIKYTEKGIVTADFLSSLMEVEEIVVPWGVTNSATEGGTEDTAFITDKTLLLAYREPNPGLMKASAGYIFVWAGRLGPG